MRAESALQAGFSQDIVELDRRIEELDGNRIVLVEVLGEPDGAERTAAELTLEAVATGSDVHQLRRLGHYRAS
jgi:hypothetical protein